ncbi:Glu/Leu/Phe/Val dehydrogenase dimerization domain-containing protein [soil metagenome]
MNELPGVDLIFSAGHQQVVFCADEASGLKAIIAIHSTALGPALGGTRFYPYPDHAAALTDVLRLSRAMSYKNSLAGLDLGGGKAVIIGDPARDKTEQLLRAYGRFVQSLAGRYITACDVGTYTTDMDIIARETSHVSARSVEYGGAGDSAGLTAFGVFQGMRASAQHAWGTPSLSGRRVAVSGVGKVGRQLVDYVVADGASVVITDVAPAAVDRVRRTHPLVDVAADTTALLSQDPDIYAPCALGAALDDQTVATLGARIVCGGANNQLAHPDIGKTLADRGVLYAPDYLVNAGGVIQCENEVSGFPAERARAMTERIFDTTLRVFALADADGVPPVVAADRLAEHRMASMGRLSAIRLPGSRG